MGTTGSHLHAQSLLCHWGSVLCYGPKTESGNSEGAKVTYILWLICIAILKIFLGLWTFRSPNCFWSQMILKKEYIGETKRSLWWWPTCRTSKLWHSNCLESVITVGNFGLWTYAPSLWEERMELNYWQLLSTAPTINYALFCPLINSIDVFLLGSKGLILDPYRTILEQGCSQQHSYFIHWRQFWKNKISNVQSKIFIQKNTCVIWYQNAEFECHTPNVSIRSHTLH